MVLVYNSGSQIVLTVKELAKESSVLCQFFHDHPFFEVFSNKRNGQFFDSEYFSKNWNWPFFDSEILKNQTAEWSCCR
jgi:hypothetical protein